MSIRHVPMTGEAARLNLGERLIAGLIGAGLLGAALVVVVAPPQHTAALARCPDAAAGCIVSVDSDLTSLAAVLAAGAIAALILALLGIRFNRVKVAGTELGYEYEKQTAGLTRTGPAVRDPAGTGVPASVTAGTGPQDMPIRVDVLREEHGESSDAVPVPVTRLTIPMPDVDPRFLHDYITARRASQHSYFLTHILGPARQPGQRYSIAIRVTPHEEATRRVISATFYLGRAWGNRSFAGTRGPDGRFGIATEAFGPFLALCEVGFDDGTRILLDHYCDFDMGNLLPA
jgi:hypothetical protein